MDNQKMFEKLERLKYGKQSNKEHNRLLDFYEDCKWEEDLDDTYSLYEYIVEYED